jgi:hypothetical protein
LNENNIIAAILTAAHNTGAMKTTDDNDVFSTYKKFCELIQNERRDQIPQALKPLFDLARREKS